MFWRAAIFEQVPVCLWLADHGLDLHGGKGSPLEAVLRRPTLLPVLKRLLELGASPDKQIRSGDFVGPLHDYAFTIRALDALQAMDRLEPHRPVLARDVVRRSDGQPLRLAGAYAAGEEMAARGIVLSADGSFSAGGVGGAMEGLWRSDGKTVELFAFPADATQPISTPTVTLKVSRHGLIYEDTIFARVANDG